jgi:hypothetical protein
VDASQLITGFALLRVALVCRFWGTVGGVVSVSADATAGTSPAQTTDAAIVSTAFLPKVDMFCFSL